MNDLFPIFLRLQRRSALVAGGGTMAAVRVKQLLAAGARVTVIAPAACGFLDELDKAGSIDLHRRALVRSDITKRFFLVIGATSDPAVQKMLAEEAEQQGLLCNVVDSVEHCNFFTPSVVERGDLKIAISTNGHSPVLARRIRQDLEAVLPSDTGEWVRELGGLRNKLKFEIPTDLETRKRIIEDVIEKTLQR